MGTVVSKGLNGVGVAVGNAVLAPVRTIFANSCEGVCSGTWDIVCFIEHLCIPSLIKLFMVLGLTCITFLFIYLLFKVGIIQCLGRGCYKMSCAACEAYFSAIEGISCFLWHKLINTKRVRRGRHRHDIEEGNSSGEDGGPLDDYHGITALRRKNSTRERRREQFKKSLYPVKHRSGSNMYGAGSSRHRHRHRHRHHHHHHVRLKTSEVSVHLKRAGRSLNSKQLQVRRRTPLQKKKAFKRRRKW